MPIVPDNVISFWVSASGNPAGDGSQQNPFDTIEKAQAAVRAILQAPGTLDQDIVVNIGGGTYRLQEALSFDARDSGRDGHLVHYRAVDGEHPVISGGMAVTGWTAVSDPHLALASGAQLWQASIDPAIDSRQLYIDGVRAVRAETNGDTAYPVGFRPSFYEKPGVAGIEYATNIDNNPNSPNWQDPTQWKNVQDIEAVIYSQWKMASVPLSQVSAPDPSTSTGLIELLDPAWTNANLIRNAPQGIVDPGLGVIQLVADEKAGYLAQVGTYIGNITAGMIVTGGGIPNDQPVTVESVDPVAKTVTLSNPISMVPSDQPVSLTFTDPVTHGVVTTNANEWAFWRVSKFVNAYDFLDQPDEWYLDRSTGTLFLVTQAGDDPNTKDIQLPLLEKLVEGNGASNMSFEGLSFQYGTWLDPSRVTATVDPVSGLTTYSADGYVSDQSAFRVTGEGNEVNLIGHFQQVQRTPGNISFHDASNVTFEGNSFSHLGGVALDLSGGAQDNRVAYNIFRDISSSAIVLGGVSDADARPASDAGVVRDNELVGNYLADVAAEYQDAAGIFVGYSRNATVSKNFITDVPWAGIAIGWGWGLRDEGGFPGLSGATPGMWGEYTTPTVMEGNRITDNTITRFLQKLWDGGAIYTTGFQDGNPNDGLNGTVIAHNYAYDKTPGAGSNVFYTDGGSRFLELDGNISFGNDQGYVNFGPLFAANDTLNADSPFALFPKLNDWVVYGSDIGGCVTYGDILYVNNLWQNLWGSLQPVWDSTKPGSEIVQLFEELIVYLLTVRDNYAQWPSTPLYFDPGQYTDANGVVYPTALEFPPLSNTIIDGLSSINTDLLGGFATTANTLAFVHPTTATVSRADNLGGLVTFGVLSLADGHTETLLAGAAGRSAGALAYDGTVGNAWLASEGHAQGSVAAAPLSIGAGVWLPTATIDGVAPLAITWLHIEGNSALATFEGGYQANITLGGSRSIANAGIADDVAVTVKRLAAYDSGLAFYESDSTTGQIVVGGATMSPGDAGYLEGALANARAAGLVVDASRLPAFGQEVTLGNLPLNDAKSYGLLVLVNNDPAHLYSSYSAANPGGATQVIAFGSPNEGITYGIEDVLVSSGLSDRDYNDLIVRIHQADWLV